MPCNAMTHVRLERGFRGHKAVCSAIEDLDFEDGAADIVLTDPPYDERVDSNVRRGQVSKVGLCVAKALEFSPATTEKRARWSSRIALMTRTWALIKSDHESSMDWAAHCERAGLVYVRCLPWIRTGDQGITPDRPVKSGAPQFTGDRPAQGHEVIVCLHRPGRMRWNRGGNTAVYTAPIVPPSQRVHPTQKPVKLLMDILLDFAKPGMVIADPFCGAGTTLVAAKNLGISAFGSDLDPKWASYSQRRVDAAGLI